MRKGGEKTKKRILEVAEKLFSEKGFDATSVGMIAKTVGINKGLIYYHFKDKSDIIISLFQNALEELSVYIERSSTESGYKKSSIDSKEKIKEEIIFLEKRKRILSVLLMEAFKSKDKNNFLLKCAESYISNDDKFAMNTKIEKEDQPSHTMQYLVHEFFTGFIPVIVFVALKDQWARYFDYDSESLMEMFLDSFETTHMASHIKKKDTRIISKT